MRSKLIAALILASLATASFAADITGKWTAEMGNGPRITFDLKAEGAKLSGTASRGGAHLPISDGAVKGDEIAFNLIRNMNGTEIKIAYKGKIAGDVIRMSATAGAGQAEKFEAKRVK